VLPFLVLQAIFGFSLLEVVNYLEHYGLLRQKVASKSGDAGEERYERCQPEHSWNSNHVASNVFLYHLERHSDHHAHPTRRYQALRHFDESPQLPSGYAALIGIALVPPLWFKLMDKRVVAHYDGDVTKANIHPPKRDKIVARWSARPSTASAAAAS
jgi:alkane 1-monooxygenase